MNRKTTCRRIAAIVCAAALLFLLAWQTAPLCVL